MKIIPNFSINSVLKTKTSPNFTQNYVSNPIETVQNNSVQSITPDYSVSKPISYNKIETITLANGLNAHYYKLANGQKVVIIPKKGPTIVKTYVNTGSMNEPDKYRGISHYIEHNLFNGSEALGDKDIFEEVNKMGAYANASTSFSVTDYILQSNLLEDDDLENKIKLQAGMLQTPKFLNEKLEKEKKIVDSEINMYLSDDTTRAETITLKNLFNIKSQAPDLIAGSTDNIDALTRDDVVNYFKNNYYPANMITVITGDVEEQNTINLVSKYFNAQTQPAAPRYYEPMIPTDKQVRQDIISKKKTGATEIFLGFAGVENGNDKDQAYLRAVNQVLFYLSHARVKDIEQKYSTNILQTTERLGTRKNDKSATILQTSVPEEYTEDILKDIYQVITDLKNNPPTDDEFQAMKTQIKKENSISMQSSAALNYHIGYDFLNETPYKTAQYDQIIDNMTLNDFKNTLEKYYDLNKTALTVVHPNYTNEQAIEQNYNKSHPVSFTGSKTVTPLDISQVKEYKMPNNFDVILQNKDTDVINYSLNISTNDLSPKKAAIGDVLNDMLKHCGTVDHNWEELAKISDKNGIESSIKGGTNSLGISGDFPVEKIDLALNLFSENILNPDLNQKLFENSVKHCKDKYKTKEPSANQLFKKAINEGTHAAYTIDDKLNSLDNITLDDVKKLYKEIITKGQGQIVVTAPFAQKPQLSSAVFNNIGKFPTVKPKDLSLYECYKPVDNVQVHTVETNRNQAEIIEGFRFKQSGNIKDDLCIDLLNTILGSGQSSRLFNDLREKRHLAYSVYSSYKKSGDYCGFALKIKTTTNNTETGEKTLENIKKSIEGFNENIKKITTEKVTREELETAKKSIKSEILTSLEMNEAQNLILGASAQTPYGISYANQELQILDSITAEDILNTAKNVFGGKPIYAVAATKEALDFNKQFLENLK